MRWYKGWYGSWNDSTGVKYLEGTFDKKNIYSRAKNIAKEKNCIVTIETEIPTSKGLVSRFYKINPEGECHEI